MKRNRKGFTLVELIVVIAILAILAAVAVPQFLGLTQEANEAVMRADASALVSAINTQNALAAANVGSYVTVTDAASINAQFMPTMENAVAAVWANITINAGTNVATVNDTITLP